jgi:predicted RNA-binding Zn ribbon-like protein
VQIANQDRVFELVAGQPVLDLVNTLDWRFRGDEPEELLESYSDLLGFAEQSALLTAKQVRGLLRQTSDAGRERVQMATKELREAVADVLYAGIDGRKPPTTPIKTLERFFKKAREPRGLLWNRSRLNWDWPEAERAVELPLWLLALSAEELMTSNKIDMVRACAKPDCRWLFLDTSKNHTRRWCDMKLCGNRMKARRFKAHLRTES